MWDLDFGGWCYRYCYRHYHRTYLHPHRVRPCFPSFLSWFSNQSKFSALLATVVGLALRLVPAVLPLLLEVVASLLSTISALKLTELAIVLRLPTVA